MDSAQDTREFAMVDLYVRFCNNLEDTMSLDFEEIIPRASENSTFFKPATTDSYYSGLDTVNVPIPTPGYTSVPDIPEQEISGDDVVNSLLDLDQVFYENSCGSQSLDEKPNQHLQTTSAFFPKYDTHLIEDENVTWNNFNMEDILISRAIQDIYNEANGLGINCNPKLWSQADANRWIDWTCSKLGKKKPNMAYFSMDGTELCLMSESDFQQKCPESGKLLWSQLELWLNVSRSTPPCNIPGPVLDESLYNQTYGDCQPCVSPAPSDSSDHSLCNSPLNTRDETFTCKTRPKSTYNRSGVHEHKQTIHLWQFLKELLNQSEQFSNCIKWIDRSKGIFKIEDSTRVAKEWGKRKNRPAMNYDKLSRSIRQYYRKGIIKKTEHSKRLVYQFCTPYL